jgi:hypothetical protein
MKLKSKVMQVVGGGGLFGRQIVPAQCMPGHKRQ